MLTGGCHCGRVRYEAGGTPFHASLCHCHDCRRAAGAPVVAWFSVPSASFRFTAGSPRRYASSPGADREFCGDCGTSLTFRAHDLPDELDITTASLDDPGAVPPADHVHYGSRVSWAHVSDGLRTFRGSRTEG